MEPTGMSEAIKRAYDAPRAAESYGRNTTLLKAEDVILSCLSDELRDKAILDIGVGTGRTVPYLTSLSQDYTGVDYSESMLKYCGEKYSDTKLLLCDARNMDIFEDGAFDAVFCCWNMLDDSNHHDRCRMLREIHRVLKQQGRFIFSAHNLDFKRRSAYKFRGFAEIGLTRWDKAVADFTKAIEKEPNDPQNYDRRAWANRNLKNYDAAVADYTVLIEKNPADAEHLVKRGATYTSMQQYEKAIADYQAALKLKPDDYDTVQRLQYVQAMLAAKNAPPPPAATPTPTPKPGFITPLNIGIAIGILIVIAVIVRLVTRGKAEPSGGRIR